MKALKIYENLGDSYNAASEYHQLGMIAQKQKQFNDAINYYQKASDIYQKFRDWRKASMALFKWSNVLEAQEDKLEAWQILICILQIYSEHKEEWISSDINDLARILKLLGESPFQVIWREATSEECAGEVREAIWTARDELG